MALSEFTLMLCILAHTPDYEISEVSEDIFEHY